MYSSMATQALILSMFALVHLFVSSSAEAVGDCTNLLQIGSILEGSVTATQADTTPKQLGDGTTCELPANSRWCKVRMGEPEAEFSMAVYNGDDIVSNSICTTGTWELSTSDITNLGRPGHALDIGANVGFYSLVL